MTMAKPLSQMVSTWPRWLPKFIASRKITEIQPASWMARLPMPCQPHAAEGSSRVDTPL